MLIGFSACEIGFSHIRDGKLCQDAAANQIGDGKKVGIAAVADGHGGAKYFRSNVGSELAVKIARSELWKFYNLFLPKSGHPARLDVEHIPTRYLEENIRRMEQEIIRRWREAVEQHIGENPWTEEELRKCVELKIDLSDNEKLFSIYGTTLLAALVAPDYWLAIQIGDGLCVLIVEDSAARAAIQTDDAQGFGYTNSLCDSRSAEKFRHSFGRDKILGVTVATDGVVDSFLPENYLDFNLKLRENFVQTSKKAQKELQAYLPKLSEQGSRDDCAISVLFHVEE
jgi:hypothetical protein